MSAKKPIQQAQPQDKFVIRFPDGMRGRIAAAAEDSGRSMNAEIVHRLEESFPFIEGELLDRRMEEIRRLLSEISKATAESKAIEAHLQETAKEFKIANLNDDPRTNAQYQRMLQLRERVEYLDALYERYDADLQFMHAHVQRLLNPKGSGVTSSAKKKDKS